MKPAITNIEVFGMDRAVKASKYPFAVDTDACNDKITERVNALAGCEKGTGHDQFLTGIVVEFDLTLTIKAWVEAERYHFLDFISSQSTMHRIAKLDIEEQCIAFVMPEVVECLKKLVLEYNDNPNEGNYLKVLYNIPTGFRLTAGMVTNYRQLKTIYSQRKNHMLPEWRQFCEILKTLPHSEWITGGE